MNKVSIVVPVYNVEKYLDRCVESLVNQDYKNIEIILVDDGSKDKSGSICDNWAKKEKNIKVIHKENGGVSSARNEGLKKATGSYIAFVDSDDYIDTTMISHMTFEMEKKDVDLVICNYYPNNNYNLKGIIKIKDYYQQILDKTLFRGYLWNKLYKKSIIAENKIRLKDNIHICEDLLFNCEYALHCNKISILDEKLYYYTDDSTSALKKPLNDRFLSVIDAYEKISKIYASNGFDNNELLISYFKVITDIIYRNHAIKNKYDLSELKQKNKIIYKNIDKNNMSFKRKIELFLYKNFPITIGNIRRNFKRRK